ncbi:PREDICTED: LOC110784230 [Prunus dulcis]|uniref:PREDICTED: LOC110784230 n=1 Tax=Prunus dulcis TaxID=3755 RepID=A0A5E4F1S6_PRUDU|nr:uncharacterized protein LOC117623507 [Prunus dulcis]KAI5337441.1 hypothetical protein L3X38_016712 [Prunus dulcis]VVA19838.1 PREDICTED: LOC110784230 [Prunus dulcis]
MEMVATTASATAPGVSSLRYSSGSGHRRIRPAKKVTGYRKFAIHYPNCFSSTRVKGSLLIRALDPQRGGGEEEEESSGIANTTSAPNSQDDLEYLGKVVAGSIVAAAVIKYGSIVFPEITRPNIVQALIMILTPVIVAILLLIKQSRAEGQS